MLNQANTSDTTGEHESNKESFSTFETGVLDGRFPFVKFGTGSRIIVVIPGTGSLTNSISDDVKMQIPLYQKIIPPNVTTYLIDYPRQLAPNATFESIATEYATLIQAHFGKVNLAAISYGGFIAIPLAAQHPELVEKLFLIVTAYAVSENGMQTLVKPSLKYAQKQRYLKFFHIFDELYNVWWIRWIIKLMTWKNWKSNVARMNPITSFITAYQELERRNGELKKYLPQIQAPTVVIGGTKDKCFSEAIYRETAASIPKAQLELIPGGGHIVPIERMKEFKAILSRHI